MPQKKSGIQPGSVAKPLNRKRRATFSFSDNGAKEVFLVGDFNNWDPHAHPMKKNMHGIWTRNLIIPPGKYEYKYLVDGNWTIDHNNDEKTPNCFGTFNSVLNLIPR